jgi:hypothetical protein
MYSQNMPQLAKKDNFLRYVVYHNMQIFALVLVENRTVNCFTNGYNTLSVCGLPQYLLSLASITMMKTLGMTLITYRD